MNFKTKIINSFTLAELLVTISIAALIMAIGIPSFIGITRGARAKEANNLVQAMLKQAQQQAMITRQRVAFFVVTGYKQPNPFISQDMVGRSFFLYATDTSTVGGKTAGFITSVQTLPSPMIFDLDNSKLVTLPSYVIPSEIGDNMEVKGFRFAPNGEVYADDAAQSAVDPNKYYFYIVIREAIPLANGTYRTDNMSNPIFYTNFVNVYTGRLTKP